ncbi:MAG: efflux RND transporter periplasmic adaptor subunit [Phycisphaerae bacterium]|nr:efflux RND transporter periplasmic adaptor subunit [Phycisphaerae bacterium]
MNTNLKNLINNSRIPTYLRLKPVRIALAAACIVLLIVVVYAVWFSGDSDTNRVATASVKRGPLVISLTESGTIQNRKRAVVKSEVEGTVTILYLIAEGVNVKKDDLLVELDSSRLLDQKNQQQITVLNSDAGFIRARENLAVTNSQTDSDISKAKLAYKFAEQDLEKYLKGEYPRELQKADADIKIADEELQRATDKLKWSKRLAGEGYITQTELKADELACKRAQINLDLANSALDLLKRYTHQRNLDQLKSDVEQAGEALRRTKLKATADIVQAEAELRAKQSEHERQKAKLEKIDDQIAKCRIKSPVSGMVVYATTGQRRRWRSVEPLDEGQQVRERQELIHLPTDAAMIVETKIHEASLKKVRQGMPVRVTVDAVPGEVFWGRVGKIGLLPDAQMAFLNPDLKVYSTQVYLDDKAGELRPGMTCRAEIIIEQHANSLYVPVQSIVRVGGKTVAYVQTPDGPKRREVKVGLDNNRVIRIIEGLKDGELVLLAPPLAPSAVADEGGQQAGKPLTIPAGTTMPAQTGSAQSPEAKPPSTQPAFDPSKLRDMSREERRKVLESLTPEQREKLRKLRSGRNQGRRPRNSPREE